MPLKFSGDFPANNQTGEQIQFLTLNAGGKFYKIDNNTTGNLGGGNPDTLLEFQYNGSSYKLTPEKDWGDVETPVTVNVNANRVQLQLSAPGREMVVFYKV
ncbi:hypothetical protein ACHAPO_010241 [Fusarium lateritium]